MHIICAVFCLLWLGRDYFYECPDQWEMTLQCNVISHWLGAFTKWSLVRHWLILFMVMSLSLGQSCARDSCASEPTHKGHDDVIKWKYFPCYWPFVRGIHRSPVNSPHKGQWRGPFMFSLICTWINVWQGSTLSFLAGCTKSHFLGWYRNFLVYWYLKLDN